MLVPRRRLGWAAAIAMGLALLSVSDSGGFRRYLHLRNQIASLKQKNQNLTQQNDAIRREVEALRNDSNSQERAVREELGYVRPGEAVIDLE
jgi:cell division protein FtsB